MKDEEREREGDKKERGRETVIIEKKRNVARE